MTMGWHTVMEFSPSLIGCIISSDNYTHGLILKSKECVINIPTVDLAQKIAAIGNCSGRTVDKFKEFKLTAGVAKKVKAPVIHECYANLECRLYDKKLISKYNFFIFEVVHAIAATSPKYPKTMHYTGDGIFMISGKHLHLKKEFRREML